MAKKIQVKRYTGVYYTESTVRKWRERPDRSYWICFRESRTNKLRWEPCGWASAGWTPEAAQRRRYELLEQDRAGSYKPKSERRKDQLTFGEFMDNRFLPWTEGEKKYALDDRVRYLKWLKPSLGEKLLHEISPLDLEGIKREMKESGRADATVRHVLSIVRHAFNKAKDWDLWHGENPCKNVSFPKLNNARQRFLNNEEATKLLDALRKRSPQVARIAAMSLYGGLRLGEVLGLNWSNVDFSHKIISVQDTKNKEPRPIFITPPIQAVLDEIPKGNPDEPLFKTKVGKPVQQLSKTFRGVVDDLKLNERVNDRRERVCFHTLRHTFASWAVMAGESLYKLGKAIGHKDQTMTQRYAHLAPDSHRSAFEAVAQVTNDSNRVVSLPEPADSPVSKST